MSGSAAVHELAMGQIELLQPEPSSSGSCTGTLRELFQGPLFRDGRQEIAVVSLPFRRSSTCRYNPRPLQRDVNDLGLGERPKTRTRCSCCARTMDCHGRAGTSSLNRSSSLAKVWRAPRQTSSQPFAAWARCTIERSTPTRS